VVLPVFIIILAMSLLPLYGQQNEALHILPSQTHIVANADGSFELYVQKVPGLESILLTDSTADSDNLADSFALRAYNNHPSFENERRILNGVIIDNIQRISAGLEPLYFLTTSSASFAPFLDDGKLYFHLHLPASVIYGYPWSVEGQFDFVSGTWFNIRAFALKNTDYGNRQYSNDYRDNPFILQGNKPIVTYPTAQANFEALANATGGQFYRPENSTEMVNLIKEQMLKGEQSTSFDVAFVIDSTISMKQHITYLKKELVPILLTKLAQNSGNNKLRLALVLYRDYPPNQYLTRVSAFTTQAKNFEETIKAIQVGGGGDIPEALYEGLYDGLTKLDWQGNRRLIIQLGDAPPHPKPLGNVTSTMVIDEAIKKNITIVTLFLPENRKLTTG
jgi:hypothetical protein